MKWKIYLYSLLWSFSLAACYSESDLTSSSADGDSGHFEFPQGNDTWDNAILEIYDKYDIKILYKDITPVDLNRTWTSVENNYTADMLEGEEIEFTVQYLKNHIFNYLSPEVVKKIFRPYWFIVKDYYNTSGNPQKTFTSGINSWVSCIVFDEEVFKASGTSRKWADYKRPETKTEFFNHRGPLMYTILNKSVTEGNIVIPEEYHEGFDYTTTLKTSGNVTNENYYLQRGFITSSDTWGYFYAVSSSNPTRIDRKKNFFQYMHLALYYSDEELEEKYPRSTYPFLRNKLDFVINYVKTTYDLDLKAIHDGPSIN